MVTRVVAVSPSIWRTSAEDSSVTWRPTDLRGPGCRAEAVVVNRDLGHWPHLPLSDGVRMVSAAANHIPRRLPGVDLLCSDSVRGLPSLTRRLIPFVRIARHAAAERGRVRVLPALTKPCVSSPGTTARGRSRAARRSSTSRRHVPLRPTCSSISPDPGGHALDREDGRRAQLGAMATYSQVITSADVKDVRPILADVSAQIADVQVRNRGTVGGNICFRTTPRTTCRR